MPAGSSACRIFKTRHLAQDVDSFVSPLDTVVVVQQLKRLTTALQIHTPIVSMYTANQKMMTLIYLFILFKSPCVYM